MRFPIIVLAALCLVPASMAAILYPSVTTQGSSFNYDYTVENNGIEELIQIRLIVPTVPDEVRSGAGWDPAYRDEGGMTIVEWTASSEGIAVGASLGGFGITSLYSPGLIAFEVMDVTFTSEAGTTDGPAGQLMALPEPGTFLLSVFSLASAMAFRRYASRPH
jgi:hypothetical protein